MDFIKQARATDAGIRRALFILLLFSVAQAIATDIYWPCLEYGQHRLTGRLVRQTYAGPPDYESVTKGDEPRVIWILQLDQRVCVNSNAQYPREPSELEIELALSAEQYAQYQQLLGERVIANGELIHGGANYRKRLVLETSELRPTAPPR